MTLYNKQSNFFTCHYTLKKILCFVLSLIFITLYVNFQKNFLLRLNLNEK